MKTSVKRVPRFRERPLLWISVCVVFALIIYFAGAVATRVMVERGTLTLPRGSLTLRCLEFVYAPLESLYDASPAFHNAFDSCVRVFVPEPKEE